MIWDPLQHAWLEGFSRFCLVPPDAAGQRSVPQNQIEEDGFRLGLWQEAQRQGYRKGLLPRERFEKLESVGMVWEVREILAARLPPRVPPRLPPLPPPMCHAPSSPPSAHRVTGDAWSLPLLHTAL